MLPASDIAEILTNLSALNLQPTATAQILAAVLAPLLRSSDPDPPVQQRQRAERPRVRPGRAAPRMKPKHRAAAVPAAQNQHADRDAPRQRAIAALRANAEATPTEIAKVAKCSRSTVINARETLAAEARKQARKAARKAKSADTTSITMAKQPDRRARAQRFLQDALAHGPKRVSDVEEAAAKAHIEPIALQQARGDLGVVTSRGGNTGAGNTLSVQWSLPA